MNSDSIKTYFSSVTLAYYVPQLSGAGNLIEFENEFTENDAGVNIQDMIRKKHYLLEVKSTKKWKQNKAFVLCNLLQEEASKNDLHGISVLLIPIRENKSKLNKIGSLNYKNLPDTFNHTITRQYDSYYELSVGFYFLIPLISNTRKIQSVNFLFRVFSYDDISVEEVFFDENSLKFLTRDGLYVNLVWRVCNFCEKFIFGEFTHSDHFFYHSECYDKMFVCDFCSKKFDGSFYRMETNLKYCENCYKYVQERVNSAKQK